MVRASLKPLEQVKLSPALANPLIQHQLQDNAQININNFHIQAFLQNMNTEVVLMIAHVLCYSNSIFLYIYMVLLALLSIKITTLVFTGNYVILYIVIPIMKTYHLYIYDLFGMAESYEPTPIILFGVTAISLISIEILARKLP